MARTKPNRKTLKDNKGLLVAIIGALSAIIVGILYNLPTVHRFFIKAPDYVTLVEREECPLGRKMAFDGVSMIPLRSSGAPNAVYFDVTARHTRIRATSDTSVGSPYYLHADGHIYAIHVLSVDETRRDTVTLKIEKETR
jgi:hypothetical protein